MLQKLSTKSIYIYYNCIINPPCHICKQGVLYIVVSVENIIKKKILYTFSNDEKDISNKICIFADDI